MVQTEDLEPAAARWLAERCELVACPLTEPERLRELLGRAEGLVVRTYTRVDAAMLGASPRLRVVGRAGVGLDNIDVAACRARGVEVVSTPDANTRAVVEFVAGLMLDAVRPRGDLAGAVSAERWHALRREQTAERELSEMTLGVYGMGRIGSQVARLGAALEMRVVYHDLVAIPASRRHGAEAVSREALLRGSDVVTVHVDGRAENRGLIGAGALALLKPDALLINTSRGFVVDAGALAAHLRAHPGARAALDVHEPEPLSADSPLIGLRNARLTPHLASCTRRAKENMSWVVRDVWRVLSGGAGMGGGSA